MAKARECAHILDSRKLRKRDIFQDGCWWRPCRLVDLFLWRRKPVCMSILHLSSMNRGGAPDKHWASGSLSLSVFFSLHVSLSLAHTCCAKTKQRGRSIPVDLSLLLSSSPLKLEDYAPPSTATVVVRDLLPYAFQRTALKEGSQNGLGVFSQGCLQEA